MITAEKSKIVDSTVFPVFGASESLSKNETTNVDLTEKTITSEKSKWKSVTKSSVFGTSINSIAREIFSNTIPKCKFCDIPFPSEDRLDFHYKISHSHKLDNMSMETKQDVSTSEAAKYGDLDRWSTREEKGRERSM